MIKSLKLINLIISRKEDWFMTKARREKDRAWTVRKQDQNPHGKVKSFKELSNGVDQEKQ